ncbi:MAG TPA: MFS transporter [Verrucomicrobiae bacterium]|nr:MFS transporter [Verrucomicrobiae bacterium]
MTDKGLPELQMSGSALAPAPSFWQRTFIALQYPNYRLWFTGQLLSLIGTWMQITAQGFLVFELTQSPVYLGYVGFAAGIPSIVLMLFGGVIADRVARRNLLIITQSAMMILAIILAALTFSGTMQAWHIVLLALALGTANAFDAPAAQAFVLELVDRKDLPNALALNATLFNLATVVGPTVAGLTYAAFGAAWCFTINAISFLAVIVALLRMRLPARELTRRAQSALNQVKDGLRYTLAHPILRTLIVVPAVAILFSTAYATLLPAWAVDVLGGNATTNGLLQSARGAGSLLGALMIAAVGHLGRQGRWLTIGTFVYPGLLLVFAAVRWVPLSFLVLAGVGWGGMLVYNMSNTLLQLHVSDEMRGRVMSISAMTVFGGMPLGSLWSGALAQAIGPPLTIVAGALIMLAFAVLFWVRAPQLRRLG